MGDGHDLGRRGGFRLELFVFPDGSEVELLVVDERRAAPALEPAQKRSPEPNALPAPDQPQQPAQASRQPATPTTTAAEAHACPLCGSDLVYPTDWDRESPGTWNLRLRCPECETERDVVLDRPAVEALNRELYLAHRAVAEESQAMARRHFEEEAQRIIDALSSGLIQPIDF